MYCASPEAAMFVSSAISNLKHLKASSKIRKRVEIQKISAK
jgi:hypothetical protein